MTKPLIDEEGEVREITAEDFKLFKRGYEIFTPAQLAMVEAHNEQMRLARGQRGPGRKPAKIQVALRLDPDIVAGLKTHPGWRQAANTLLREWLGQQQSAE